MTVAKFLKRLISDQPLQLILVVATMTIAALFEGVAIALLVPLLTSMSGGGGLGGGKIAEVAGAVFSAIGLSLTIRNLLIFIFFLAIGQYSFMMVQQRLLYRALYRFEAQLRERLYAAIFKAGWPFFLKQKVGRLTAALTTEVTRAGLAFYYVNHLLSIVAVITVLLCFAAYLSWQMTTIMIMLGFGLMAILRGRLARAKDLGAGISKANADLQSEATEQLISAKLIKGCALEDPTIDQFNQYLRSLAEASFETSFSETKIRSIYEMSVIGLLCVGVYIAAIVLHMPTANLIAFLVVFYKLAPRLTNSQIALHQIMANLPAIDQIETAEAEALEMKELSGDTPAGRLGKQISLDNIYFDYIAGETILKNVSINLEAGRTTAIVGGSGAGKSTLVDLVMGLIVPSRGNVLVDGAALKMFDLHSWRRQIGYVAQDTILFHATVKENIGWGLPDITDHEIEEAAKLAYADDFIAQLAQGYDTIVGDRGVRLSGGQRQRLALARALARKPNLLILDEATSALDAESERKIQEAISSLARKVTILVVTHRLAAIQNVDYIYVLENGQVVEEGTWEDLTAAGGRFSELRQIQELAAQNK